MNKETMTVTMPLSEYEAIDKEVKQYKEEAEKLRSIFSDFKRSTVIHRGQDMLSDPLAPKFYGAVEVNSQVLLEILNNMTQDENLKITRIRLID